MRGRNNNNRKGPNPLTRNYESNGPDVKIRGSAQQIAEKYAALARDAMSAGDRVIAENYLQHAEHYNRIIAAAQAQMPIQQFQNSRDEFDDEMDDERDESQDSRPPPAPGNESQPTFVNEESQQPVIEGIPAEVALGSDAQGASEEIPSPDRTNGHANGYNAEDNGGHRRGRRPRRPRRPDFGQEGQGDMARSEESGASDLPRQLIEPIMRREKREESGSSGDAEGMTSSASEPPPASSD